jgi:hypothetical protein
MKTYGGIEGITPPFLTSALDISEWSDSSSSRFNLGTLWIRGWVSPRDGLDAVDWTQRSCPCRKSIPARRTRSPSLYRLSYRPSVIFIRKATISRAKNGCFALSQITKILGYKYNSENVGKLYLNMSFHLCYTCRMERWKNNTLWINQRKF